MKIQTAVILTATLALALFSSGCTTAPETESSHPQTSASAPTGAAPPPTAVASSQAASVPATQKVIRIKAGVSSPVTDSAGNVWQPDQGFEGGDVIERPDIEIANTKDQVLYRAEHYGMDSFSQPLPNGKYQVKLHFAETYDGISGPGERVFSFTVQGHEYKDFDVWKKAGGPMKAYVETVDVEITDGKLVIKFTSNVENPEINAIEIIPAA